MKGRSYQDFKDGMSKEEQDKANDIAEEKIKLWKSKKPGSRDKDNVTYDVETRLIGQLRQKYGIALSNLVWDLYNRGIGR